MRYKAISFMSYASFDKLRPMSRNLYRIVRNARVLLKGGSTVSGHLSLPLVLVVPARA